MRNSNIEILVGVFVALGLAALFMLAMKVSNINTFSDVDGYDLVTYFDGIGGLKERAPVAIAGVRVGRVKSINLNNVDYRARVIITLEPELLPMQEVNGGGEARYDEATGAPIACSEPGDKCLTPFFADASASILTAGLLGEQYIGLDAGGGVSELLAVGEEIELTQSAIGLEQVVGQFIYGGGGKDEKDVATDDEKLNEMEIEENEETKLP